MVWQSVDAGPPTESQLSRTQKKGISDVCGALANRRSLHPKCQSLIAALAPFRGCDQTLISSHRGQKCLSLSLSGQAPPPPSPDLIDIAPHVRIRFQSHESLARLAPCSEVSLTTERPTSTCNHRTRQQNSVWKAWKTRYSEISMERGRNIGRST